MDIKQVMMIKILITTFI